MFDRKIVFATVITLLLSIPACIMGYRSTERTLTITVTEKEMVTHSESSSYLVWTEEGEVFSVDDSLCFGVFNSSDLYGKLRPGKKYRVKVAGWRVPPLSMYRNIFQVTEIKK